MLSVGIVSMKRTPCCIYVSLDCSGILAQNNTYKSLVPPRMLWYTSILQ